MLYKKSVKFPDKILSYFLLQYPQRLQRSSRVGSLGLQRRYKLDLIGKMLGEGEKKKVEKVRAKANDPNRRKYGCKGGCIVKRMGTVIEGRKEGDR